MRDQRGRNVAGIRRYFVFLRGVIGCIRGGLAYVHRGVKAIEPWALFLAVVGLGATMITMLVELDDRKSERTFRAWELILTITDRSSEDMPTGTGSAIHLAMEYLNRESTGWGCAPIVRVLTTRLTGSNSRECLVPRKEKESMADLRAPDSILNEIDLRRADLRRALLSGAELMHARLAEADLSGAVLEGANLFGADLEGAKLYSTNLRHASIRCVNMSHAELGAIDMTDAYTVGPHWVASSDTPRDIGRLYCRGEYLLDLTDSHVRGGNFSTSRIPYTNFSHVDFGSADLKDALITGSNLSGANLTLTRNLTQDQLDSACADPNSPPEIPERDDLTWNGQDSGNSSFCDYLTEAAFD